MYALVCHLGADQHDPYASNDGPVFDCADSDKGMGSVYAPAGGRMVLKMDAKTRDLLNALDAEIRTSLASVYAEAKHRGRRSLLQLASGEMSLSDFEERER